MQINFEAKQLKEAHAYVDRLTPIKNTKKKKTVKKEMDKNLYSTIKEDKPSFIKSILNFLFK
jgi:hypothetical protein